MAYTYLMTTKSKTNRRVQTAKPRNEAFAAAMRDVRRSSAAEPHKNKAKFNKANRNDWKRDI